METNFAEFTGKTVEEAVEEGLAALNLTKEEAVIEVVEEPKKMLFFTSKAKVRISKKVVDEKTVKAEEEALKEAVKAETEEAETTTFDKNNLTAEGERTYSFLVGLFERLGLDAEIVNVEENEKLIVTVKAENNSSIIGQKGEILDSVQTLAGAVANIGREEYMRVVVDCGNYREKREESLKAMATKVASKAVRFGKKMKLQPMNPYERRIIHSTLADSEEVKTKSEGKEPNRYVVIIPNNLKPYSERRPYNRDRKPYNKDRRPYNGERRSYNGERKPYNRDRKPYDGERRSGYNRNSSSGTGTSNYGKSSYTGGSYRKKTTVLGTFLGNSGNTGDKEE